MVVAVVALAGLFLAGLPGMTDRAAAQSGREWVLEDVRAARFDEGSLLDPRGVAGVPGSGFYVTDRGHNRIALVDDTGLIVRSFGTRGDGPIQFSAPSDVAVDAARDRVYVADEGNRRLSVFTRAGTPIARWRTAGPDHAFVPHAVAVAQATGEVYVVSRLPWGRIDRFAADGRWLDGWGSIGGGAREFRSPEDLAVHPDGRVVVADTLNSRLQIFSAAGDHVADLRNLPGVIGVDVDAATGNIYALYGADAIRVFLSNGGVLRDIQVSDLADDFRPGVRLALGDGGRMAVATGYGARDGRHGLRQYSAGGGVAAATLADPLDDQDFFRPGALDVGPDGTLYVADVPLYVTKRYAANGDFIERFDEASGDEVGVGPAGDIYVVSTPASGPVRLRRLRPDGRVAWDRVCDCFSGIGVAASADRLYVTEALTHTVGVFRPDQATGSEIAKLSVSGAPYAWPLDVALGPDDRLYAAGGESGRIDVFEGDAGPVAGWAIGDAGGAERISVGPDGTVFALLLDGTVAAYSADGALERAWRPEAVPGADLVLPKDLAAGPGGRLYLLDEHTGAILVYGPRPAQAETPTPETTPDSPCTVAGTKTAAPDVVTLGEEVTVALTLDIRCPPGTQAQADVVLVLDRSNSMSGDKLDDAKRAAQTFVDGLDLSRHRVGLVSFSDIVSLDQALTPDGAEIRSAIDGVQAHGATDIASALDRALQHLTTAGRPGALGVVLLLTDGEPSGDGQPYVDTVRHGSRARARGMLVYSIGLGANVDAELLTAVAGSTERYFFAPDATELEAIYRQLSQSVDAVVASDVQVIDDMGPDVDYVPGSAVRGPVETGRRVTWAVGVIPDGGMAPLTLRVKPRVTGRLPTNTRAVAQYTAAGQRFTYVYPVPEVLVVDAPTPSPSPTDTPVATDTPTPTDTPVPTATPTRRPDTPTTVYLPFASRDRRCPKDNRRPADIMLVIDTSSSMRGEKLAQAVDAAQRFLTLVSPARDRVGVASFDSAARRVPLTDDLGAVSRALAGLETREGTRIDLGLFEAMSEFYYHGREGVPQVAILLSDGQPMAGTRDQAREQAVQMRDYGVTLFVIGLGADADGGFLSELASSPSHFYFAPAPDDLASIYERIAVLLPCF